MRRRHEYGTKGRAGPLETSTIISELPTLTFRKFNPVRASAEILMKSGSSAWSRAISVRLTLIWLIALTTAAKSSTFSVGTGFGFGAGVFVALDSLERPGIIPALTMSTRNM